jgi:hypothetical protein
MLCTTSLSHTLTHNEVSCTQNAENRFATGVGKQTQRWVFLFLHVCWLWFFFLHYLYTHYTTTSALSSFFSTTTLITLGVRLSFTTTTQHTCCCIVDLAPSPLCSHRIIPGDQPWFIACELTVCALTHFLSSQPQHALIQRPCSVNELLLLLLLLLLL